MDAQPRPTIRRTYGKPRPAPSSSSSGLSDPLPSLTFSTTRSSSPPTSTLIFTPPPSSPPLFSDAPDPASRARNDRTSPAPSSPLWSGAELEDGAGEFGRRERRLAGQSCTPSSSSSGRPVALVLVDPNRIPSRVSLLEKKTKPAVQSSLKGFFIPKPRIQIKRPRDPSPTHDLLTSPSSHSSLPPSTPPTENVPPTRFIKSRMTQLHLTHLPLLHTCLECHMSYVRGGTDDAVHERHHVRVTRGVAWHSTWAKVSREVAQVGFGDKHKGKGRVLVVDGSVAKINDILLTVDTVLSAPPLPPIILAHCKVFLFVTSSPPPTRQGSKRRRTVSAKFGPGAGEKERVVGVVVAQGIKWAMRVLGEGEAVTGAIDSGDGVVCDPTPLPTPLGIHRLFTIPNYRSLGIASALLDAAAAHTVYGCAFDSTKGEVAFSQPTASGRRAMERWGKGAVRVFVDDERQV